MELREIQGRLVTAAASLEGLAEVTVYNLPADTAPALKSLVATAELVARELNSLADQLDCRPSVNEIEGAVALWLAENAERLYALGDQKQQDIATALGVAPSTVSAWLSRTIKDEKERKKVKAYEMWLACATQQEIAEAVSVHVDTASDWCGDFSESSAAEESEKWQNFDPPLYNVWKQQTKSNAVGHFGYNDAIWTT